MDRITGKDTVDIGGGKRGFRDQSAEKGIKGTEVNAAYMNGVQEELMKIITDAGIEPSAHDWTQLSAAIGKSAFPKFGWQVNWFACKSDSTALPPDNAKQGDIYYIPSGAAGAWEGKMGQFAIAQKDGGFVYAVTKDGHGYGLPDGRLFIKQSSSYKELKFDVKDKTGKLAELQDINNAVKAEARAILTKAAAETKDGVPTFTFLSPQAAFDGVKVPLIAISDIDNTDKAAVRDILTRSAAGGTFLTPQAAFDGVKVPFKNIESFPAKRLLPPGAVQAFAMPKPPEGWLKCNGAWVGRKDYPELYAAIADIWGLDDKGVAFRLPDLRGEFIRGWIDDRIDGPITQKGRVFGSWEENDIRAHKHAGTTNWTGEHTHKYRTANFNGDWKQISNYKNTYIEFQTWDTEPSGAHNHTFTTENTGGDETRPQNFALLYCIKC